MEGEEALEIEEASAARRRIIVYLGKQRELFERLSQLAEQTELSASWQVTCLGPGRSTTTTMRRSLGTCS
jgi:predicted DNA-binding protein with PD1-like motif